MGNNDFTAIIDFYNGNLRLDSKHHSKFVGLTFIELPEPSSDHFPQL